MMSLNTKSDEAPMARFKPAGEVIDMSEKREETIAAAAEIPVS